MGENNPFIGNGYLGNRGEASFSFSGDNEKDALRRSIHGLRRALWKVESALATLETRSRGKIDPDQMRPQFAAMFEAIVSVTEEFFGLCLGVFGDANTLEVVQNFSRKFDWLRRGKKAP